MGIKSEKKQKVESCIKVSVIVNRVVKENQ